MPQLSNLSEWFIQRGSLYNGILNIIEHMGRQQVYHHKGSTPRPKKPLKVQSSDNSEEPIFTVCADVFLLMQRFP